jgi:hypothetical protein
MIPDAPDLVPLCPVCGARCDGMAEKAVTVPAMVDPQPLWPGGPVVEGSSLGPRQYVVGYDWTFSPCGHEIRDPEEITFVPRGSDTLAERRWYLMFKDPDGGLDGLIGPIVGDKPAAETLMAQMLATDQAIEQAVDWQAAPETVCARYTFGSVQVLDLSPDEVKSLGGS